MLRIRHQTQQAILLLDQFLELIPAPMASSLSLPTSFAQPVLLITLSPLISNLAIANQAIQLLTLQVIQLHVLSVQQGKLQV